MTRKPTWLKKAPSTPVTTAPATSSTVIQAALLIRRMAAGVTNAAVA